ncbi:MAG: hypothetical protein RI955_1311 [Bacteroidota bacterium]|jgi:energy-coupling factor transporter transmembrane protein EcfT
MKEIIVWTIFSGLLFFVFLATFIFGLIKKTKKNILISIGTLILFIGCTGWTSYLFVTKSYNKVAQVFKPRTGEEIYSALFGKTNSNCLQVVNYQDQVVPKIDYAIWLHFTICPNELKRILKLHDFEFKKQSTKGWQTDGPSANEKWFKPETLGDSVLVFKYHKDDNGNGQTIYSSLDSTKVFCIDVLD